MKRQVAARAAAPALAATLPACAGHVIRPEPDQELAADLAQQA